MDLTQLFRLMAEKRASDLFFSAGAPVYIKIEGDIRPVNQQILDHNVVKKIAYALMTEEQIKAFEAVLEMNFGLSVPNVGRFRVNVFRQRGSVALVIRYITDVVPTVESLRLPPVLSDLVMHKRGLILVVGATGSGKSTSLAAMIDHRNRCSTSHILAIEDPIEFIHRHQRSIVNQREVGIDTQSYAAALVNALREAPDVLLIGEIRDQDTMRQAMVYTQTGHLCLATLHANNAYHAMNRIIGFFPVEAQEGLLLDLALSLRAVVSQRLVRGLDGKRVAAVEVLINNMHIGELIQRREIDKIKDAMEQSMLEGSQTFEESLLDLVLAGTISKEEALSNADSRTNIEWLLANSSKHQEKRAKQRQNFKVEDKVAEEQDEDVPSLLSMDDLSKIGIASAKR
ncbi:MAG: PilT/PilU family type 4a pilus ATPase [Hydrogenophilales bacterium]|nr:PilT/PilU family type 4a pilus ATPase [Hydrogenophilales bacterium]